MRLTCHERLYCSKRFENFILRLQVVFLRLNAVQLYQTCLPLVALLLQVVKLLAEILAEDVHSPVGCIEHFRCHLLKG